MKTNHLASSYIICLILSSLICVMNCNAAWVQKATFGGEARHRCTGFSIGTKGYIGGGHTNSGTLAYFKDYWEYDPGTNCWTQIADFGGGYRYHSTAFSIGNFGYVGLGENELSEYKNDFWKYIPLINTWVQISSYPGTARRGACSFVIEDKGYVGTGQDDMGYTNDFYCYNPTSNSWSSISNFMGEARSSCVAFSNNGKGYLGTGHILGDDRNDFYEYDPISDLWNQKADVGPTPRQDATGFVLGNEGYIGTGNNTEGTDNYADFWKYNFETDTWIQIADFDGQSRRYMVSFVIDQTAYCGTGTNGTNLRDFWAFYPLLNTNQFDLGNAIIIYPNPATNFIHVKKNSDQNLTTFLITDLAGNIIQQGEYWQNNLISVESFVSGQYLIHLFSNNDLVGIQKIQVNK